MSRQQSYDCCPRSTSDKASSASRLSRATSVEPYLPDNRGASWPAHHASSRKSVS